MSECDDRGKGRWEGVKGNFSSQEKRGWAE